MPEQHDAKEREQGRDGHKGLIVQDHPAESAIDSLFYEQGRLRADLDRLLNAAAAKPAEPATPPKEKEAGKDGPDASKPADKDKDKDDKDKTASAGTADARIADARSGAVRRLTFLTESSPAALPEALTAGASGTGWLVKPGQTATLTWEQAGIRAVLAVTCLDAGRLGQVVRVRFKNAARIMWAKVTGEGTLRASP